MTHGERRRWVRAEWGRVWGGVSPLQPILRGLGELTTLPQRSPGHPGRKRIMAYFEGHRTLIFVPMTKSGGGQFALASPAPNSGGTCLLCPPPVIYAHGCGDDKKDWSGKSLWQSAMRSRGCSGCRCTPGRRKKIVGVIYRGKL